MNKYFLDYDKCFPYFYDHIVWGNTLSGQILNDIDFMRGNFFTILPKNFNHEQLEEFSRGGILQPVPSRVYDPNGRGCWEEIPSTIEFLVKFIQEYLTKSSKNFCVGEDVIRSPDSKFIHISNVKILQFDKEVYYFTTKKNNADEIRRVVRASDGHYHMLLVLASGLQAFDRTISLSDFEHISEHTQYVIASAYDGEGYLVWEKKIES